MAVLRAMLTALLILSITANGNDLDFRRKLESQTEKCLRLSLAQRTPEEQAFFDANCETGMDYTFNMSMYSDEDCSQLVEDAVWAIEKGLGQTECGVCSFGLPSISECVQNDHIFVTAFEPNLEQGCNGDQMFTIAFYRNVCVKVDAVNFPQLAAFDFFGYGGLYAKVEWNGDCSSDTEREQCLELSLVNDMNPREQWFFDQHCETGYDFSYSNGIFDDPDCTQFHAYACTGTDMALGETECSVCSLGFPGVWRCLDDDHLEADIYGITDEGCNGDLFLQLEFQRNVCKSVDEHYPVLAAFGFGGKYIKSTWNGDCHSKDETYQCRELSLVDRAKMNEREQWFYDQNCDSGEYINYSNGIFSDALCTQWEHYACTNVNNNLGEKECNICSLGYPGVHTCLDDDHVHVDVYHIDDAGCNGEQLLHYTLKREECTPINSNSLPGLAAAGFDGKYIKMSWNGDCHSQTTAQQCADLETAIRNPEQEDWYMHNCAGARRQLMQDILKANKEKEGRRQLEETTTEKCLRLSLVQRTPEEQAFFDANCETGEDYTFNMSMYFDEDCTDFKEDAVWAIEKGLGKTECGVCSFGLPSISECVANDHVFVKAFPANTIEGCNGDTMFTIDFKRNTCVKVEDIAQLAPFNYFGFGGLYMKVEWNGDCSSDTEREQCMDLSLVDDMNPREQWFFDQHCETGKDFSYSNGIFNDADCTDFHTYACTGTDMALGETECSVCSLGFPGVWRCLDSDHVQADIYSISDENCNGQQILQLEFQRNVCKSIDEDYPELIAFGYGGKWIKSTWNGDCHSKDETYQCRDLSVVPRANMNKREQWFYDQNCESGEHINYSNGIFADALCSNMLYYSCTKVHNNLGEKECNICSIDYPGVHTCIDTDHVNVAAYPKADAGCNGEKLFDYQLKRNVCTPINSNSLPGLAAAGLDGKWIMMTWNGDCHSQSVEEQCATLALKNNRNPREETYYLENCHRRQLKY